MGRLRRFLLTLMGLTALLTACSPALSVSSWPNPELVWPTSDIPLVVYERTGGPDRLRERWAIYPGGEIVGEQGLERRLTPETLMALMDQVERSGFFELEDIYLPQVPRSDAFAYALTVQTQDRMKTVVTSDDAPGQPQVLRDLIERVDRLVRGNT